MLLLPTLLEFVRLLHWQPDSRESPLSSEEQLTELESLNGDSELAWNYADKGKFHPPKPLLPPPHHRRSFFA